MPATQWPALLADRYGRDAFERLTAQFRRPCSTFAGIAKEFGVSRERVRQWHLLLMPDAPRGHERQRLCARYRQKRRLLEDPLFRAFYRHVRPHVKGGRIELIKARDGYRTRVVEIDHHTVALKEAIQSVSLSRDSGEPVYTLARHADAAAFIYYRLTGTDYLLLPGHVLTAQGGVFVDAAESPHHAFKNTCDALRTAAPADTR